MLQATESGVSLLLYVGSLVIAILLTAIITTLIVSRKKQH
jgi:hypothetical protein